jgi:hypothetical protein
MADIPRPPEDLVGKGFVGFFEKPPLSYSRESK